MGLITEWKGQRKDLVKLKTKQYKLPDLKNIEENRQGPVGCKNELTFMTLES